MSEKESGQEMSFVDHLEELRWHLIRAVISILITSVAAFVSMKVIFREIILAPSRPDFWTYRTMCKISESLCVDKVNFILQSRLLSGQFTMHFVAAFTVGFVVAFPYVFWEIWRFVKPGLYETERKSASGTVLFVTILFILGILFAYFIIAPLSINFLANYSLDEMIVNQFDITSYVGTLCMIVLGGGLMFQLPVVVYVLSKMGVMTPKFMRSYRKHAIVILVFIAALITPSPDVLSQMLVAVPLYLLYEFSIYISVIVTRKNQREPLSETNV